MRLSFYICNTHHFLSLSINLSYIIIFEKIPYIRESRIIIFFSINLKVTWWKAYNFHEDHSNSSPMRNVLCLKKNCVLATDIIRFININLFQFTCILKKIGSILIGTEEPANSSAGEHLKEWCSKSKTAIKSTRWLAANSCFNSPNISCAINSGATPGLSAYKRWLLIKKIRGIVYYIIST